MYKLITTDPGYFGDEPLVSVIDMHDDFMYKCASVNDDIVKFVSTLKPREDGIYIHINALGGSNWGSNNNGDYFESDVLAHEAPIEVGTPRIQDYGYKTFVKYAYPFKHHVNKDINLAVGEKVAFSTYNDRMDRVQLVTFIDRKKDADLVKKAESGRAIPVSMGCKVLYDECSICGNQAKKRDDYCEHLKYAMNQTLTDGRKVYAINKYPRFFDISFVLKPAEQASYVMDKVASSKVVVPSVFIADALGVEEPKRAEDKSAEIKKEIPVEEVKTEKPNQDVMKAFVSLIPKICSLEPSLPDRTLGDMAAFPLRNILSTITGMGMVLKPREFQKIIILKSKGGEDVTPIIDSESISDKIISMLKPYMVDRSSYRPALRMRVVKLASQNPVVDYKDQTLQQDLVSKGLPTVATVAAILDLYRSKILKLPGSFLIDAAQKKPIITALLGAVAAAGVGKVKNQLEKTAALNLKGLKDMSAPKKLLSALGVSTLPYFVKAHKEEQFRTKGKVPGDIGMQFVKHPAYLSLASFLGAARLMKKASCEQSSTVDSELRMRKAITWPLVSDAPPDIIDLAIVNGFYNL